MEECEPYSFTRCRGWLLYNLACGVGPKMVRWLSWVAKRGYLLGMHANLGNPIDLMFAWPMQVPHWQGIRKAAGMIPTTTHSGNHHFISRQSLPPKVAMRVDAHPRELMMNKWQERERVFRA